MINAEEVVRQKEQIVSLIQSRGPMLPVQIAKSINNSTIFTSAFLSELVADQRVKTSNLRVGSSYLYLIQGQEPMLEKFIEYLNSREKEAFYLIKEKGVLEDSAQSPVIRVAIRAIPDFAVQFEVQQDSKKTYWRYFLIPEEEALKKVSSNKKELKQEPQIQENQAKPESQLAQPEEKTESPEKQELSKETSADTGSSEDFLKRIEDKLKEKNIELLVSLTNKKKEFAGQAKTKSVFGEQMFYVIAKDKKKLSEKDFSSAVQKAYSEKMPLIFLSQGIPDKKAAIYLAQWHNFLRFEQLKP